MTLMQKQDEDRTGDVRGAMKSAAERVSRDTAKVKELQAVGRMIVDYVGGTRGVDQLANLKVLVAVKSGADTNLFNLESAIRDAGMSVLKSYLEKVEPDFDKPPTNEAVAEWSQDQKICPLLRNALSIGSDPAGLARVRAAIKRNEGSDQ